MSNDICNNLEISELDEVVITEEEYENIINIQNVILKMVAYGVRPIIILNKLCKLAEELLPNAVASIMFLDKKTKLLNVLAAPTIPPQGHRALANLKPGIGGGSCGNAVFRNEPTFVRDTLHDAKWSDLRKVAYNFNICSCWSMPVRQKDGKAIATFALSSFEHRMPSLFHKNLLQVAANIVLIVLNKEKVDKKMLEDKKRIKLFAVALQNSSEGLFITDKNNKITEINNAFTKVLGYSKDDVLGKDPKIFASDKQDKKFYQKMWHSIETKKHWNGEIVNQCKDGVLITQWLNISAITDKDEKIEYYLAEFTDISELKHSQNQIKYLVYHDGLTNVYNKTYLQMLLDKPHHYFSLVLLNVDNFSYVNLAYGFTIGDKLLKAIVNELKTISRDNENIFRINSDEFAVICSDDMNIIKKIDMIREYFNKLTFDIDNITLHVSFSYGISLEDNLSLQNSALALKQAREGGKNQYVIFDKKMIAKGIQQREDFVKYNNILHDAIAFDMFVPYFQGILNNKTKKINKFESLVRIVQNEEVISPFKFLQTAKLSGMLVDITKIMIDKSFKKMSNYDYIFSINITEDDLDLQYLQQYLKTKSKQYSIAPNRVILEILEGMSSSGKQNNIKQLIKLKGDGYLLAIDDFGAEYSNFERVLDLNIDFLKIDAKYIKNINTDKKSYEIVKSIVYFAKNANISCVAEFVHCKEVQKIVEELGIDFSQGYLFSEPKESLD